VTEDSQDEGPRGGGGHRFATTHWSLVLAAGKQCDPASREALAQLCEIYWHPVYAYVRRRGPDQESARDLTQGFFTDLLARGALGRADRTRGRFRSFLLASLDNFLSDTRDRERAKKRGGGEKTLSFDFETAETNWHLEPTHDETPERIFDRRWAMTLLGRTLERLREERAATDGSKRFECLQGFLTGDAPDRSYRELADELGTTEAGIKASVHRLRRRYGELLREEVARTVSDPGDVDGEIRHLLSILGS